MRVVIFYGVLINHVTRLLLIFYESRDVFDVEESNILGVVYLLQFKLVISDLVLLLLVYFLVVKLLCLLRVLAAASVSIRLMRKFLAAVIAYHLLDLLHVMRPFL